MGEEGDDKREGKTKKGRGKEARFERSVPENPLQLAKMMQGRPSRLKSRNACDVILYYVL